MLVPVGAIRILTVVSSSRQVIARNCRFAVIRFGLVFQILLCFTFILSLYFASSIMHCVLCNSVGNLTVLFDTVFCTCTFCNCYSSSRFV